VKGSKGGRTGVYVTTSGTGGFLDGYASEVKPRLKSGQEFFYVQRFVRGGTPYFEVCRGLFDGGPLEILSENSWSAIPAVMHVVGKFQRDEYPVRSRKSRRN
jgi:hypothetical protein